MTLQDYERQFEQQPPDEITEEPLSEVAPDRKIVPLTVDEVKGIIANEIQQALGNSTGQLAQERRLGLQYYRREPFGNEVEGRSKVIVGDVADTVEWILPQLMRIFMGGSQTASFNPHGPEDEAGAKQATRVVNKIFRDELGGFMLLHQLFKSAMLSKTAEAKVYWERRMEPKIEQYDGLTQDDLVQLLADGRVEPIAVDQRPDALEMKDPQTGQVIGSQPLFDVQVRHVKVMERPRIDLLAPEEFLIAARATTLDDETPFTAQRKKVTKSDLIAMGYPPDVVAELPSDDMMEYTEERTERRNKEDTYAGMSDRRDVAGQHVWLTECHLRIDEDGDGYTELRRITVIGDTAMVLLDDELENWNPFISITPVPMPHQFDGLSLADLVMDLQLIRSTLMRQMLDNLYLLNNPRTGVIEGEVEIDDLLTSVPGGVVRMRSQNSLFPLEQAPFPAMAFNMLEYLESVRENRTGITRYNQGLDATSLNQTATGISAIMGAAAARIELIARIFAEMGLKPLFKKLLRLMVERPMKARVMRLENEWVQVDPASWNSEMDVEVELGLGTGQAAERVGHMQLILQLQEKLAQSFAGFMVKPQNVYRALTKLTEAIGFSAEGLFFADPAGEPPPEPPPDPKMIQAQTDAEEAKAKMELEREKLMLEARKMENDLAMRRVELEQEKELEMERIRSQERIAEKQAEAQIRAAEEGGNEDAGGTADSR